MQQIYRRAPMGKCDFNKVVKQFKIELWHECSPANKFAAYFQNTFS